MLTFFGGKGGVGKTTCSAAAAVRAASEGKRVLVVSTDPAHSLADALGVKLGASPTRVKTKRGELRAAQLDADRALARWLDERDDAFRTLAERGTYLDAEDVDRLMSLSLPGVDELVGLLELQRLIATCVFDEVVVDTAPTGHTLRMLSMPETLQRLAQVLDDMHAKHRFLAQSLGGVWRGDFADAVIDDVERSGLELRAMLEDPRRTSFSWVTLPERLSVDESLDGIAALAAMGIRVGRIVVNRAWPVPPEPCPRCAPRIVAEESAVSALRARFPEQELLAIAEQDEEPRGVAALEALANAVYVSSVPSRRTARSRSARQARQDAVSSALPAVGGFALLEDAAGTEAFAPLFDRGVRLLFFGGKGGVGKTTSSAAAALALARRRPTSRVLLLSTDPAHSLGDVFGEAVGDTPAVLDGETPNLFVRELDAQHAFERLRERYRGSIDELFSDFFRGSFDVAFDRRVLEDLLDLAPPGFDELFAVLSIVDALVPDVRAGRSGRKAHDTREIRARQTDDATYDLVVVDTAPTGHTLRLLELPKTALAWVHAIMAIILKYRNVVGLGELASDVTDLARRLRLLIDLLRDPARCAFVAVTRAAELPRLETERLVQRLGELAIPLAAVVVNRVSASEPTEGGRWCARCAAAARAEAREISALSRGFPERLLLFAPAASPPPRGAAALRAWWEAWGRPAAERAPQVGPPRRRGESRANRGLPPRRPL